MKIDRERLPSTLLGVIGRYVPTERQAKLENPDDALRLQEDLGLDSLTLMEISLFAQDALQILITDDEMQHLRTLGDLRGLMERKICALQAGEIGGPALKSAIPGREQDGGMSLAG